jgi:hypothetical protein
MDSRSLRGSACTRRDEEASVMARLAKSFKSCMLNLSSEERGMKKKNKKAAYF